VKQILIALVILGLVFVLNNSRAMVERSPLAMVRAVENAAKCAGDQILYRGLALSCRSPIAYVDMRKLDMRADNKRVGQSSGLVQIDIKN